MYSNYSYWANLYQYGYNPYHSYSYSQQPYYGYDRFYHAYYYPQTRQQPLKGQATWTDGGQVTKCNIPWSDNQYMTAAVGADSPFQCGQSIKVRNLTTPGSKEIIVTVVDQVKGYPTNRLNLHRKAFEALGATVGTGVIDVEIIPSPELEQEKWGKYLLSVTQTAYPSYKVIDYKSVEKTAVSADQTREVFEFVLQSPQESIKVRATVLYNPNTDRVITFDLKEV